MAYNVLTIVAESAQRDLLTHSLQNRLGYCVLTCASAGDAAGFFVNPKAAARPDLMLLDWSSAGGRDAASILKEFSTHAPLVALVRYGDYDAGIAAVDAGAQDFLTKPVAMERISTTFRNLLLLRDAQREAERLRRTLARDAHGDAGLPGASLAFLDESGNIRRMQDIEAEVLRFAVQCYHGRMTEVAKRLGIGRSTLYRKLSELGVNRQEEAA